MIFMQIPLATAEKILKRSNMRVSNDAVKEFAQLLEEITFDIASEAVAIAKSIGSVLSAGSNKCQVKLVIPVCADKGDKVAISKQVGGRWHLVGWAKIL